MSMDEAVAYARNHELHAILVHRAGTALVEEYGDGRRADAAHAIYSGTKSFWGIAALEAANEGILDLDAPIGPDLPEWGSDDVRSSITPRMLLSLTAGYGFGGLGSAVPTYERALQIELKDRPGTTFTYSGVPFQVFGAYFARRLADRGQTPHEYLRARVLEPAGVSVPTWKTLADGAHPLPTGAFLTAADWLKYGAYVGQHRARFAEAFAGTAINPRYGLGWWRSNGIGPDDCFYASGSGGQGLYVAPSSELVAVHFGAKASYKHDAFLRRLFR